MKKIGGTHDIAFSVGNNENGVLGFANDYRVNQLTQWRVKS